MVEFCLHVQDEFLAAWCKRNTLAVFWYDLLLAAPAYWLAIQVVYIVSNWGLQHIEKCTRKKSNIKSETRFIVLDT